MTSPSASGQHERRHVEPADGGDAAEERDDDARGAGAALDGAALDGVAMADDDGEALHDGAPLHDGVFVDGAAPDGGVVDPIEVSTTRELPARRDRRPTIEIPPGDLRFARSEYVRYQQAVARVAMLHGELGAARAALRVLNGPDFADAAAAAAHIRVLRSIRHHDVGVELAIEALLLLDPCSDR